MADNLFDRLVKGRPAKATIEQPTKEPAQLLLDFLQRWPKTTISSRDIRIWGPGPIRNRKSAIDSAEILVKNGWLIPNKTTRSYGGEPLREWQIVRKAIVSPVVAT